MSITNVPLDSEIVELLEADGDSLEQRLREITVLDLYRRAVISTGKGARLLGMDYLAFARFAGENGIPHFRYSPEELDEEVRKFGAILSGE
ncbi:MAG: UPF0175 family protein [Chloroflexota bacterium]